MANIRIEEGWKNALGDIFDQEFMSRLRVFLKSEHDAGHTIYPPLKLLFNAFDQCPFDHVKVVIIGQDPYHGVGQANGMSFSVAPHIDIPPSLQNIYKELHTDIGMEIPHHGDLKGWAQQGVLLLNTTLSVRAAMPMSHRGQGWEDFTDHVITVLNQKKQNLVFLLWGSHAQSKAKLLDSERHLLLTSAHPSPLSAHRGFFGCRHFSQSNAYLQQYHNTIIDWNILNKNK